jgi:hypothetical protein
LRHAVAELGCDLDFLQQQEEEPGLGNVGLGRLASCFMDSPVSHRPTVTSTYFARWWITCYGVIHSWCWRITKSNPTHLECVMVFPRLCFAPVICFLVLA